MSLSSVRISRSDFYPLTTNTRAFGMDAEGSDCTDEVENIAAVIISRTPNSLESFQDESNQFFVRMVEDRRAHWRSDCLPP